MYLDVINFYNYKQICMTFLKLILLLNSYNITVFRVQKRAPGHHLLSRPESRGEDVSKF